MNKTRRNVLKILVMAKFGMFAKVAYSTQAKTKSKVKKVKLSLRFTN
jgi:hypothetical protein